MPSALSIGLPVASPGKMEKTLKWIIRKKIVSDLPQVGNLLVIPWHQTLKPTDTKQAAISTKIHMKRQISTSMKAEKKLGSRPRLRNLTNLANCMTDTTNMITATKMVKLQYACDAQSAMYCPSCCCQNPLENRRHFPLNWSWFIDMGTQMTKDRANALK